MSTPLPPTEQVWTLYCDGSAAPNPGPMGLGAVLHSPDGDTFTVSHKLSSSGCNNQAELHALLAGATLAQAQGAMRLVVYTDSRVIDDQLGQQLMPRPHVALPHERLRPLIEQARTALAGLPHVTITWIPRHRNGQADALARAALGLPPKPSSQAKRKVPQR